MQEKDEQDAKKGESYIVPTTIEGLPIKKNSVKADEKVKVMKERRRSGEMGEREDLRL